MTTIELNGVTLYVSEVTAEDIMTELNRERLEQRRHWLIWHWHARRWAMYGNEEDGSDFSDMYKEDTGCRPRFNRNQIMWILYERENWLEHGLQCREYRKAKANGWGLY